MAMPSGADLDYRSDIIKAGLNPCEKLKVVAPDGTLLTSTTSTALGRAAPGTRGGETTDYGRSTLK